MQGCPRRTTLMGWVAASAIGTDLRPSGRPTILQPTEEAKLADTVRGILANGGVVDGECLCKLAGDLLKSMRGAIERARDLGLDRCQSFHRRHRLTRLRTPNSDRPTDTPADVALGNDWRRQPGEILETPSE